METMERLPKYNQQYPMPNEIIAYCGCGHHRQQCKLTIDCMLAKLIASFLQTPVQQEADCHL